MVMIMLQENRVKAVNFFDFSLSLEAVSKHSSVEGQFSFARISVCSAPDVHVLYHFTMP